MAITDKLRKWWVSKFPVMDSELHKDFTDIASRIDAEHERKIGRAAQLLADAEKDRDANYANWQDCKQKVLQHNITMDELSAEIEHLKDELAHRIEPPKDADGEYIHEHDKVNWRDHSGTWHKNVLVVAMCSDGCYVMDGMVFHVHASDIRHHHAPTVEDVLHEFICDHEEGVRDEADLIAEYAAKLRLAGGDE